MRVLKFLRVGVVILFLSLLFVSACSSEGKGRLALSLTDAATDAYQAVYVTISEIQVHNSGEAEGTWETVLTLNETHNLLELANGVRTDLGLTTLSAGYYTQMRLIIGDEPDTGLNILGRAHAYANYVIDAEGELHELKVPSGEQTGVKIVTNFDVSSGQTTELILDFNAAQSVVVAGNSGQYLLKPTIKILNTAEYSIVGGVATDSENSSTLIAGALVMAQVFSESAEDEEDVVTVEASTITNDEGEFMLFLEPGSYNLVISKKGYVSSAAKISLASGETASQDFALRATQNGEVTGVVTVTGAGEDDYATLSFEQDYSFDGGVTFEKIEVASLNIASGSSYLMELSVGDYDGVCSSVLADTLTNELTVTADTVTIANFDL